MIGGGFQNLISTNNKECRWVEWTKDGSANLSIHIDHAIMGPVNPLKRNFAWIYESSGIVPDVISYLINNIKSLENEYELIFTHDRRLLSISPIMRWCVLGCKPWIKEPKIYPKSKLISMIASTKIMCRGHVYRQEIAQRYGEMVDLFGTGRLRLDDKLDGLADYYFSISMENDNYPSNFTEKIGDCFATGTIPIFWGASDINQYFNSEGIILLDDRFDINQLSPELYNSKKTAIIDNFKLISAFPGPEDFLFENYLSNKF